MSVQPCWVEVRPLPSGKFEVGNFSSVIDYLYNIGKPFRFYAVNCPSGKVEGLRTVRLFLQLQGGDLAERLANALKSTMDVEVIVGSEPPRKVYPLCAEFALKGYSAQPVCPHKQKPEVNPLDVIIGALSEADSALEVLAVEDRKGKLDIQQYISKKLGKSASFANALMDQAVAIGNAIAGVPPPRKKKCGPKEIDVFIKTRVDAAAWKGSLNLFRCEVKAYGDAKTVEAIGEALPSSALNRFRMAKRLRAVEAPPKELGKPKGREVKASLLRLTAAVPPLLFVFAWLFLGAINPLRLANVDLFAVALAAASTAALLLVFRKPEPLILCRDELSLIVGIPTAVGRLPVETGTARLTREQLTFAPPLPSTAPQVKAVVEKPVKVAGVLKDEATGKPLPNREFEVYDEKGNRVYAGKTDEKGAFEIAYAAEKPESLKLEIRLKSHAEEASAS